jgi:GT2 family glycosyltransferase
MTALSIVIVSYSAWADLERCLQSLEAAPPAETEVIVVDNASTDDSPYHLRRRTDVRLIELPDNRGFAAACNVGIRASRSDLILLLNSDTIVPAGAIDRLRTVLASNPTVAVVGPRLVDGAGRAELSFGAMMSPFAEIRQQRIMRALGRGDLEARTRVEAMTRREQLTDWVSGACLLVRRTAAEEVGLLDERFFLYAEDVDFCAAIRAKGWQVLFTPAAEIVHIRGRSGSSDPAATRDAYRRSHLAFYQKHHPRLAPLLRLYQAIRG